MMILADEVRQHPNAVFVRSYGYRTFKRIKEDNGFYRGGLEIVSDLFREGNETRREILLKPNVTSGKTPELARQRNYHGGIVTNPVFIGGMIDGLHTLGESNVLTRRTVSDGSRCGDNGSSTSSRPSPPTRSILS
jgi:hypothetical protein